MSTYAFEVILVIWCKVDGSPLDHLWQEGMVIYIFAVLPATLLRLSLQRVPSSSSTVQGVPLAPLLSSLSYVSSFQHCSSSSGPACQSLTLLFLLRPVTVPLTLVSRAPEW
ncbi:uncharacterized protein UDID_18321 [Ustilago sp. UG-2017a]|nr:uncharacterized protein UDID_18321 [Ustilago sp. UG-2017a]